MRGIVTIYKVYDDGSREEVIRDKCNILTDGFGIAAVNLFSTDSSQKADDYTIAYFQVGTSSYSDDPDWTDSLPSATANNFYSLSAPVSSTDLYGTETTLKAVTRKVISVTNPFEEASALNYNYRDQVLCEFESDSVSRLSDRLFAAKFLIDRDGLVGQGIKEFGLFIKNPEHWLDEDRPVLAAYKSLEDVIQKNNEFTIDVEWIIDVSNDN